MSSGVGFMETVSIPSKYSDSMVTNNDGVDHQSQRRYTPV